jgi:cytochrome c556
MKTLDEQSAALGEMASGVIPQDNMGAHMQMLSLAASMALKAFTPKVAGGKAKPEVWSNWDDFSKKMNDFAQRAAAGAQAQGQDAQLGALVDIANGCKGCHDMYRQDLKGPQ